MSFFEKLEEKYNIKYVIDNTCLVSYPKSGRTWLRMIMAKLLELNAYDTDECEMIPVFHKTPHKMDELTKDAKVVFMYRNPADTIISYFHERKINNMVTEYEYGGEDILRMGKHNKLQSYTLKEAVRKFAPEIAEYNSIWNLNPFENEVFYIKYEEMKENIFPIIEGLMSFLEFTCTKKQIQQAIEYSSFDNMKKIEETGDGNLLQSYKGTFAEKDGLYGNRIRKGKADSYLEELDSEDISFVNTLNVIEDKDIVRKEVDGFKWALDVTDGGIGAVLARSNSTGIDADFSREKLFMLTLNSVVKEGMVCIDIGANIGYSTMYMIKNSGKAGKVLAIEPDDNNLVMLKSNIVRNLKNEYKDYSIEISNGIISDFDGESDFWIARHPNLNSVSKTKHSIRKKSIRCCTLETYCKNNKVYPNFIKMDIEGHEVSVFNGAYNFFKENRGETHILLEVHPKMYNKDNDFAKTLRKYQEIGFNINCLIATPVPDPAPFRELGYKADIQIPSDGWVRSIYTGVENSKAIELCTNLHDNVPGGKCVRSILVSRRE